MKTKNQHFKLSQLAIVVGLTLASAQVFSAADKTKKEEEKVEKISILGSYIKGSDTVSANPVSVVSAEEMEFTGAVDTADLVNLLPVNSGAENRPDTFTSFYSQGTSNVNLRGLGLSSTLVLINGKRQTLSGAKAQDGSVFVDTSSIPAIALDRVEVLKEGAAATYGSDAIAGVVNFVTNDYYEGIKVSGSYHTIEGYSQNDKNMSILAGFDLGDSSHVVMAASILRRSNLRGWERPDLVQAAASSLGTGFKLTEDAVVTEGPWAGNYSAGEQVGNPNCAGVGGNILDLDGDGDIDRCGFKYGLHYNIINEEEREQYYAALTNTFANDIEFKSAVTYSDYRIIDNYSVPSLPNLSFPTVAADNSTNPFGVDAIIFGRHNPTLDFSQSRAAPRANETFRLEAGLTGVFSNDWDWSTSLAYSANEYEITQPEMSLSRLFLAMDGQGGSSGDMTFDHFSTNLQHDPVMLDWLKTDFKSTTQTRMIVWDGVVNGELFQMPAGSVYGAFGAQFRNESYKVSPAENSRIQYDAAGNPDPSSNDFTFLGQVNPVDESRSAYAIFAEMEVPLLEDLTMNVALRYEDLDTDSNLSPKIAFLYSVTEKLSFRASASTSFREPSMSQFNADVTNTVNLVDYQLNIDGTPVLDANGKMIPNTSSLFIRQATTGNSDLKAETATNFNLGALWSGNSLQVRFDYWNIAYEDVITIESAQAVLDADPNGPSIVRQDPNDPTSTLAGISTDYFNAANIDASGIDVEVNYGLEFGEHTIDLSLSWSRYLSYEVPANGETYDAVGSFNFGSFVRSMPEDKGNFSAHWINDKHSIMARVDYVSSYINNRQGDTIESFTPVEVQYRYLLDFGESEAAISLGVQNLFDEDAPFVADGANFSYDPKQHDPRGRVFYMKASYEF